MFGLSLPVLLLLVTYVALLFPRSRQSLLGIVDGAAKLVGIKHSTE